MTGCTRVVTCSLRIGFRSGSEKERVPKYSNLTKGRTRPEYEEVKVGQVRVVDAT